MNEINETKNSQTSKRSGKWGVLIALILLMSGVSATLLTSYGTVTGTADVSQGVVIIGDTTYIIGDSTAVAGQTYVDGAFTIKNNADIISTITLDTKCSNSIGYDDVIQTDMSIDWSKFGNDYCDGIVTKYFGVLELTTKDTYYWIPTDDLKATIHYTLVGDDFIVSGIPDGYVLVYYPNTDGDDFATNVANALPLSLIAENLPIAEDVGDDYCGNGLNPNAVHCNGAKLWLIPAVDEAEAMTKLASWSEPDTWLFETDLITYTKGTDNKINLPANGGGFDFVVENALDAALASDTYTLTTDVSPAY